MKLVYENTTFPSETNSKLNLIAVFQNEEILLPYFIDYYKTLGVTHFYLIDNLSNDQGNDYLRSRKDINIKLFYTDASYKDSYFGSSWQNECMDQFCNNEYCLRVDIDELFQPHPKYNSLQELINEMDQHGNNTLPALMLDIYPETLNNDYRPGMPFASHSQYFDKFNAEHFKVLSRLYQHFYWIEGGFRSRFFNTSNMLHKFPLVKNVFTKSNLYMGPHFFYQEKQTLLTSTDVKLHQPHALLLHYKFLKPDILDYLAEQVDNKQHWNNSEEYQKYYAVLKQHKQVRFFDEAYSRHYKSPASPLAYWELNRLIAGPNDN